MFSFFKKSKIEQEIYPLSINIDIDSQENTYLTIDVDSKKIEAESFAKALYCINSGLLASSFLSALIKLQNTDKFYVLKVMDKWDEYISLTNRNKKELLNNPIIKPTEAFFKNIR